MREIKFRAWDKKRQKFENYFQLDNTGSVATFNVTSISWEQNTNLILNQYTGLKDKNDKEIYELDVVSLDIFNPLYNKFFTHKSVVIFEDGMFKVEKWGCSLKEALDREDTKNGVEVIGNIYEDKLFGI